MSDSEDDLELFLLLDSNYCLKQENTRMWIHGFNEILSHPSAQDRGECLASRLGRCMPEEGDSGTRLLEVG
jgi:hypothetical protein